MRGLSGVIVISVITSPYPEYIDENNKNGKNKDLVANTIVSIVQKK